MRHTATDSKRVTFVGDVVTDLLVRADQSELSQTGSESFMVFDGAPEQWASFVRTQPEIIGMYPGGSMANAAAAFVGVGDVLLPNFVAAEWPHLGLLGPHLGDVSIDRCFTDLKERGVRLSGVPQNLTQPTLPGAVISLDSGGNPVSTVAYAGTPVPRRPISQADIFVCRSDHLSWLLAAPSWNRELQHLMILLADDASGLDDLSVVLDAGVPTTIFASKTSFSASELGSVSCKGFNSVLTDGPGDVEYTDTTGETNRFATPPVTQISGSLGAGDAYLGGWVAAFSLGLGIAACHEVGCRCAMTALKALAAREMGGNPYTTRLPRRWTAAENQNKLRRDDELAVREVHRAPGISVVTGGQTGVETWGAREAESCGIPTFVILPAGRRRDEGDPLGLVEAREFELRSESYQYRTWHTVLAADAVLLLDWHQGEGSAETRLAADVLGRPLLEVTPGISAAEASSWVVESGARSVLLAGNRESHFGSDSVLAHEAIVECCTGIVQATAELAGGSAVTLFGPVDAVAAGAADWARRTFGPAGAAMRAVSARDAIRGVVEGDFERVLSWPGLLPHSARHDFQVTPVGAFACQYGFVGARVLRQKNCVGIQYREAFDYLPENIRSVMELMQCDTTVIPGKAEQGIMSGKFDIAYDTRRTGRTAARFGLEFFSVTNWETLSIIQRKPE